MRLFILGLCFFSLIPAATGARERLATTDTTIKAYCDAAWSDDRTTRDYCVRSHHASVRDLARLVYHNPQVSDRADRPAIAHCAIAWPNNVRMQSICLDQVLRQQRRYERAHGDAVVNIRMHNRWPSQAACRQAWPDNHQMRSLCLAHHEQTTQQITGPLTANGVEAKQFVYADKAPWMWSLWRRIMFYCGAMDNSTTDTMTAADMRMQPYCPALN